MKIIFDSLSLTWIGLVICAVGLLWRHKRPVSGARRRLGWVLVSIALLSSAIQLLCLPTRLLASLERPFYQPPLETSAAAEAVVVCGGGWAASDHGLMGLEFNEAGDRLLTAVEVARSGRVRELVLGGGGWGHPPQPLEGRRARQWMEQWHLLNVPITVLESSKNTHDEALRTAALARERGWNTLYLVTSAGHMRRALATFRRAGVKVIPIACDYVATTTLENRWRWWPIPRTFSADHFSLWLQEVLGLIYYKARGWA